MRFARFKGRVRLYACIEGAAFGLTPDQVLGESQCRPNVMARRAVWKRLSEDGFSLCSIGRMTNRDHSTIVHGLKVRAPA